MRAAIWLIGFLVISSPLLRSEELPATSPRPSYSFVNDKSPSALSPYHQKVRVQQFEQRFNKLVHAVEQFATAYNQNKGQAWPADKAAALRKAIAELQSIDPSFKPLKD